MQSHGLNIGGTMTIEVGRKGQSPSNVLVLPITPNQSFAPNMRTTVTQTISGIFVDRFGVGIPSVTLNGNTGWASPVGRYNGQYVDGNTAAKHLLRDILYYYENAQQREPNGYVMSIYNDVTSEAWDLEPVGTPVFQRVNSDSLTLTYTIQFVVLRDLISGTTLPASGLNATQTFHGTPSGKIPDPVINNFDSPQLTQKYAQQVAQQASVTAQASKQTKNTIRVVQSGDNLWTIAENYLPKGASSATINNFVKQIASLNKLANSNLIFPGEQLQIPS